MNKNKLNGEAEDIDNRGGQQHNRLHFSKTGTFPSSVFTRIDAC